ARRKRVRREIKADIDALPGVRERVELSAALDERLDEEALDRRFLDGPVEACVARIREGLGLPAAEGADDPAPEPSAHEPPTRRPAQGGPASRSLHSIGLSP